MVVVVVVVVALGLSPYGLSGEHDPHMENLMVGDGGRIFDPTSSREQLALVKLLIRECLFLY